MTTTDDVLAALRRNTESEPREGWRDVYLDNAAGDLHLTRHQFAGHLSVLEKRGLYHPLDGYAFGEVYTPPKVQVPEKPEESE